MHKLGNALFNVGLFIAICSVLFAMLILGFVGFSPAMWPVYYAAGVGLGMATVGLIILMFS